MTPGAILTAALDILDGKGAEALTMRTLAGRLGISPMAIYHHFGDRDGLIRALADRVYAGVAAPEGGTPRYRIAGLLASYRAEVLRHPGLTLAIFSRASLFPDQARRITGDLSALLADLGLSPRRSGRWLAILVDHTHGAALAAAMRREGGEREKPEADAEVGGEKDAEALEELLDALEASL